MNAKKAPRALIVEDDPDIRQLLCELLTAEGIEAIPAADGEEALHRLACSRPDIITLDLNMPKITGWQLLEILASSPGLATLPVVVVAAHTPAQAGVPLARVAAFHTKPFHIQAFLESVRRVLKIGPLGARGPESFAVTQPRGPLACAGG